MSDYKTLFGKKIKFTTTDLSMSTATEGEIFYSNADTKFKVGVVVEAWSAGGNINTARYSGGGAGSSANSALYSTGYSNTAGAYYSNSEEYNGTAWTEGEDVSQIGQSTGGSGTQTAAWVAGRGPNSSPTGPIVATEEYDGTDWTAGGNMNTSVA